MHDKTKEIVRVVSLTNASPFLLLVILTLMSKAFTSDSVNADGSIVKVIILPSVEAT